MLLAARELETHGSPREARKCLERALSWQASLPTEVRDSPRLRLFEARTLYLLGRLDEARAELQMLNAGFPGEPAYLGHLGAIAARSGAAAEARAWQGKLARLQRPYLFGEHTLWRARISALLGEGETAVQLCWQAVGEGAVFGAHLLADPDLATLRDHAGFQEFLAPKG
jgi:predicted Zn-dependent protease